MSNLRLIKLTRSETNEPIFVNINLVQTMERMQEKIHFFRKGCKGEQNTLINLHDKRGVVVVENIEMILNMIDDCNKSIY